MNIDGTPNQTNVQAANAQGSVANVRSYFQSIFNRTQNSSDFDAQAAAMRSCYNIVIQQPPVDPNACPAPAPLSS
jgi:ribosomal protein S11